jgi:hypothetical protein
MKICTPAAAVCLTLVLFCSTCFGQGGPPVIGDDPGTPGSGKWEINISYPYVQTARTTAMDIPYLDLNYGFGDHIELSYLGGYLIGKSDNEGWQTGWDDSLAGVKWRFLDQDPNGIDMSIYPQLGYNTTSSFARIGLAESGLSFFMPVEIEKDFGKFEFDAEVGYQYYEHDRGQWAGGPIFGYNLTEKIELVAEARMVCDEDFRRNNLVLDGGARIGLVDHTTLLISLGRGLRNDDDSPHFYLYAGVRFNF